MPSRTQAARDQQRPSTQRGTKFQAGAGLPWLLIIIGMLYGIYSLFRWLNSRGISGNLLTLVAVFCCTTPLMIAGAIHAWSHAGDLYRRHRNRQTVSPALQDPLAIDSQSEHEIVVEGCTEHVMDVAAVEIMRHHCANDLTSTAQVIPDSQVMIVEM